MTMNFIEKAFKEKLTGDEFLQAMADYLDEPDLESILKQYPCFVKDVIMIIDYDYTKQMESMDEVINGSLEEKFWDIIYALERCGFDTEVKILKKAKQLSLESPDDYDEQWDLIEKELAYYNDYEGFWDKVRAYIDDNISY